jgi:regulator of sirC expression with transglutaminase-like and TPR domain
MTAAPPPPEELDALVRLLDDENPLVRERVRERFALCSGDISEWLATRTKILTAPEQTLLIEMLSPARREALARDWIAPSGGAAALSEDWELFEAMLRILSDFLHDGITLRQSLADALDLLAEEVEEAAISSGLELCIFLFQSNRLRGNPATYYDPRNSDLAWCLAEGQSNPLGLCLIAILIAKRLDLEIEGVNFPRHFMCRVFEDGYPIIIDCFDKGRQYPQENLLESPELNRDQRSAIRQTVTVGTILLRLLNNLSQALEQNGRELDAELIKRLQTTLR